MSIRVFRLATVIAALTLTVNAQTQRRATSFSPTRLWDGKTPDFRGIWQVRDKAYMNLEAPKSIIVDPPDGKIPYKPEALAKRQENYRNRATADPHAIAA